MIDRTSSSGWVRGLAAMFAAEGVNLARLLQAGGITSARLEDPGARFGADEVTRLWESAVALSGNPLLGLDRELASRHIDFELIGFAMLSSTDLRAALGELARYLALISSATTFEMLPNDDGCWLVMGHTGFSRPLPPQRSAYSLLSLLVMSEWATRRPIAPKAAHFGFAAPAEPGAFERAFGCPVRFAQADNRLLLGHAELSGRLPLRNPDLLVLHEQVLEERLAALANDTVGSRVKQDILVQLRGGEPRRQEVAARLGMTDRSLQRRLRAANTSFQQLLEESRREMADKYLEDATCALGEVAHRLGFADQSNFFRACRRWFGCAPGQRREHLLGRH